MKSKSIKQEHLFVCECCHKINDITSPVEKARADEREKILKWLFDYGFENRVNVNNTYLEVQTQFFIMLKQLKQKLKEGEER